MHCRQVREVYDQVIPFFVGLKTKKYRGTDNAQSIRKISELDTNLKAI